MNIKLAFRGLLKHKGITLLNLLGLVASMSICLLILQYVAYERNYDAFHPGADQIYRLRINVMESGVEKFKTAGTPYPLGPALQESFAEVEQIVRVRYLPNMIMKYGDRKFYEPRTAFVDSSYFRMFGFKPVAGSLESLNDFSRIAISESAAKKYFPNGDALGKILEVNSPYGIFPLTVGVIYQDPPRNTYLNYDFLLSLAAFRGDAPNWAQGLSYNLYVKLKEGQEPGALTAKYQKLLDDRTRKQLDANGMRFQLVFQPLRDVYLSNEELLADHGNHGIGESLYFLLTLALCVLAIGWFNNVNLSFATAIDREKEVTVRKYFGAVNRQLVAQFFTSAVLLNLAALVISLGVVLVCTFKLPIFVEREHAFAVFMNSGLVLVLGLALLVGITASGLLPSLFFASFSPVNSLTSRMKISGAGLLVRKGLLFAQLAFSFSVMAFLFVCYQQINLMKSADLGFNERNLLIVKAPTEIGYVATKTVPNYEYFRNTLLNRSDVQSVGNTVYLPTENKAMTMEVQRSADNLLINCFGLRVDPGFAKTFEITLKAGRYFSAGKITEEKNVVINDKLRQVLGFPDAASVIGKSIVVDGERMDVIGVTENFVHRPVKQAHEPLVLLPVYATQGYLAIRVSGAAPAATTAAIGELWGKTFTNDPFEYFYLDDFVAAQFQGENQFMSLLLLLTALAIIVTFMGILALSLMAARNKVKELGIRLVLGASPFNIIRVLSRDTLYTLLAAVVIMVPFTYFAMNHWLQNFPTRIGLIWYHFLFPVTAMFIVLGAIVSYVGVRVIHSDPVKSLRM